MTMRGEIVYLAPWVVFALLALLLALNVIGVGGRDRPPRSNRPAPAEDGGSNRRETEPSVPSS